MIKNIIFDFGDVFINLDKEATNKQLLKLQITENYEELVKLCCQYEIGLISTNKFISFFHNKYNISKKDIIDAWNAILLDFPQHRLLFLKQLAASKKYQLFLLSNTNELHITWIKNTWGETTYRQFKNCFKQFYLSHEINLRKPDKNCYEFVLHKNNLNPSETFFIDDSKENTDAAQALGIKVWNINPKTEDVVNLLSRKEFI
ncbi:HAD-IA family hydrolase [Tenacibaculum sp. UWU-22]|uniref:HAD-IA family hydrolase n=1 Tax=Tenacibaculum sp. UWU-22 TaxID=3234187 RepID=UPI0034DB0A56